MNILVTGGAGFIGSHLVDKLVHLGHDVTVVDDLSNGSLDNLKQVKDRIHFYIQDISIPFEICHKPDLIYNLACWPRSRSFTHPSRDVEVNICGMVNVLELARRSDAKVVFSSNSGIYDTTILPITEESPENPKTPYDLNKRTAERYLELYNKTYDVDYTIFRFATVYGPRQRVGEGWKPVIIEFIDKLSQGIAPTIYWNGEQTRDFIYVDDIVENLMLGGSWTETKGPIILATGKETSINQLYKIISQKLEVNIPPNYAPKTLGDIPRMQYLDNGYARVTIEQGIDKILEWRATQ